MPVPAIAQAISAPRTPVATPNRRGSEKTPAPTIDADHHRGQRQQRHLGRGRDSRGRVGPGVGVAHVFPRLCAGTCVPDSVRRSVRRGVWDMRGGRSAAVGARRGQTGVVGARFPKPTQTVVTTRPCDEPGLLQHGTEYDGADDRLQPARAHAPDAQRLRLLAVPPSPPRSRTTTNSSAHASNVNIVQKRYITCAWVKVAAGEIRKAVRNVTPMAVGHGRPVPAVAHPALTCGKSYRAMAVALMRLRFTRAHEHGEGHNKGCGPAPAAQCDGGEQRPHERAAQHEKNRNHADMAARRCIAWRCALRGAGRSLNRQRQDVGGVSRRDRENQVRTSALGEPWRCYAGMCHRRPPQP